MPASTGQVRNARCCSRAAASTGAEAVLNASPGCFWRPGDFLSRQYCLMLSMESMIPHSSRRGGGGRQTFPVPLSRKIFALFVVPFMFPRPGPCCKGCGPGEGNRGGNVGYYGCPCCGAQNFHAALRGTLEILTAATRSLCFLCHQQRSVRSPRAQCALAMTHRKKCDTSPAGEQGRPPLRTFFDRMSWRGGVPDAPFYRTPCCAS